MKAADFEQSPSGTLVPTVYGQKAFVPNKLPPVVDFNKCMSELDRASRAMAELKGMSYKVDNPLHLINPLQQREAIASSSIEGTYTTPSELLLFDTYPKKSSYDPDIKEVYNYRIALQNGLELLQKLPISSRLIKIMHKYLLHGVKRHRGSEIVPGEYKRDQNFIGNHIRSIEEARFIPPPPAFTERLMSDLENFVNAEESKKLPPVLVNALVHYQFETIHPFPDGNGRVGRILLPLVLASQEVMPTPLLYISPFIEKNREEYNDLMLDVSKKGEWEPWIRFFSEAVEASALDAISKIDKIAALKEIFLQQVREARASGLLPALIDLVFDRIIINIPMTQKHLSVTYRAASNNIGRLVDRKILVEMDIKHRPRSFVCQQLMDLVFDRLR